MRDIKYGWLTCKYQVITGIVTRILRICKIFLSRVLQQFVGYMNQTKYILFNCSYYHRSVSFLHDESIYFCLLTVEVFFCLQRLTDWLTVCWPCLLQGESHLAGDEWQGMTKVHQGSITLSSANKIPLTKFCSQLKSSSCRYFYAYSSSVTI